MKVYSIAQFDQHGKPFRYLNMNQQKNVWVRELTEDCLVFNPTMLNKIAEDLGAFVITYDLVREMPKVCRSENTRGRSAEPDDAWQNLKGGFTDSKGWSTV